MKDITQNENKNYKIMYKHSKAFLLTGVLISLPFVAAAIDTSFLAKVTPQNATSCVEYYRYKNDLFCSTTPSGKQPTDPKIKDYELQQIGFDERPWKLAWGKKSPAITTIEYIPAGTSLDNWKEKITAEFIPGLQNTVSPWEYAHNAIESMKQSGFNPTVNIIENTPDFVIFEFQIKQPPPIGRSEIQQITKGSDGLYILQYAVSSTEMDTANRNKWIENLRRSNIIKK